VKRKTILLNAMDNVATALTDLKKGEEVNTSLDERSYDLVLLEDVDMGHKIALQDLAEGETITKYGMPIGRALVPIRAGQWVHVHNCRSHRWGFHNEKYGLKA